MVALAGDFLDDIARAELQQERDLTARVRTQYRARLNELRRKGPVELSYVEKIEQQIEACSTHIRRMDKALADA